MLQFMQQVTVQILFFSTYFQSFNYFSCDFICNLNMMCLNRSWDPQGCLKTLNPSGTCCTWMPHGCWSAGICFLFFFLSHQAKVLFSLLFYPVIFPIVCFSLMYTLLKHNQILDRIFFLYSLFMDFACRIAGKRHLWWMHVSYVMQPGAFMYIKSWLLTFVLACANCVSLTGDGTWCL